VRPIFMRAHTDLLTDDHAATRAQHPYGTGNNETGSICQDPLEELQCGNLSTKASSRLSACVWRRRSSDGRCYAGENLHRTFTLVGLNSKTRSWSSALTSTPRGMNTSPASLSSGCYS